MTRSSGFRLSRKALDRLAALAEQNGISRATVLELLIRRGKWLNPPTSERKSPKMTRPLDKLSLRTANEAMRRATVVEDVYVALKTLLGQWERHRWLCEWGAIALQSHPDADPRQRLQRHVNDTAERVICALFEQGVMWRDLERIPDLVYWAGAHRETGGDEHFVPEENPLAGLWQVWLTDDRGVPNDGPDSPWDSTSHRLRDVTADLIDAPDDGDVLTLLRLLQARYSSVEEDEEVAV